MLLYSTEGVTAKRLECGYDVMVACQLPKLIVRVRFPLPAPTITSVTSVSNSTLVLSSQDTPKGSTDQV